MSAERSSQGHASVGDPRASSSASESHLVPCPQTGHRRDAGRATHALWVAGLFIWVALLPPFGLTGAVGREGVGPTFPVALDLSRREDFGRAVALDLCVIDRRGNRFLIAANGADLVALDSARLDYEVLDDAAAATWPAGFAAVHDPALSRRIPFTYCSPVSWASTAGLTDDPAMDTILARLSVDSLVAYATRLQAFQTRFTFSDSNAGARDYILGKFRSFGYTDVEAPAFYAEDREYYPRGGSAYNVVCTKPGTVESDEVVVLGAHYDSRVTDGTDNWLFAPGGDRNASGVATLLEVARVIHGIATRKRIIFAAFGAGEQRHAGSNNLASWLYGQPALSVELMINLDGLAFTSDAHPDLTINSLEESLAFGRLAAQMVFENTALKARIREDVRPSDWEPFNILGYHWIDIIEGDYNPAHNTAQDLIGFLNPYYWGEVTKMAGLTTYVVAATPSAVDSLRLRDVGDGSSLAISWAPLPGADIIGYRLYKGTESGALKYVRDVDGASTVATAITDLTEGQMYYISVAGLTSEGRESSVQPEVSLAPLRQPRTPSGVRARAGFRHVDLSWDAPIELDIDHYMIYRGIDSVFLSLYDPNSRSTQYADGLVNDRVLYYYQVVAVDQEGNRSPRSATVAARGATFDEGTLVLNLTSGNPSDAVALEQAAFYHNILGSYVHGYYRPQNPSLGLDRSELGLFRTLIWVDDDASQRPLPPDFWTHLNWYLSYGNSVIIAGWRVVEDLANCRVTCAQKPGDFLYDYLDVTDAYQMTAIDCLGGIGTEGFPNVVFDTAKVPGVWQGRMGFLWGFKGGPDATIMLAYNSASGDSSRHFNPVGMRRNTGRNKIAVMSLPMYFLRQADAAPLVDTLLKWFGIGSAVPGDLNRDRAVDVSDIHLMVNAVYGKFIPIGGYSQVDFNNDCRTDILDVLAMIHRVFFNTAPLLTGCTR